MKISQGNILFFGLSLLAAACGSKTKSEVKTILGEHNFKVLGASDLSEELKRSMGALFFVTLDESGQARQLTKYCSGIQLKALHVLTNAHCLKKKADGSWVDLYFTKDYVALDGEESRFAVEDVGGSVYLRFKGQTLFDPSLPQKPNLKPVFVSQNLDFALLEITDQDFDSTHLLLQDAPPLSEPRPAELLAHPNAMPLTLSRACEIAPWSESELRHDCDSAGGSSGGLLYDAALGIPLALHRQGFFTNDTGFYLEHGRSELPHEAAARECREKFKIDGNSPDFSVCVAYRVDNFGFNRALPLSKIFEELAREAPSLAGLLQEK